MSKIVQFKTNQGLVFVEVDDSEAMRGEVLAANVSGVAAEAKMTFEDALKTVKPGIDAALDLLTNLVKKPNETQIEFGIKIDAAAGAIFAKASAEATFNITLTWK